MSVETDAHGRLYLPAELRAKYGDRFHIVEYEDRLELIPIADDPLSAVRDAAGDAFDGKSIAARKRDALEQAQQEATADLERARELEDASDSRRLWRPTFSSPS